VARKKVLVTSAGILPAESYTENTIEYEDEETERKRIVFRKAVGTSSQHFL
jgi:hypothetical protein